MCIRDRLRTENFIDFSEHFSEIEVFEDPHAPKNRGVAKNSNCEEMNGKAVSFQFSTVPKNRQDKRDPSCSDSEKQYEGQK